MESVADIYRHLKKHKAPTHILDAIATHRFTEDIYVQQLKELPPNSVDRIFADMRRVLLLEQVRKELKELVKTSPEQMRNDRCTRCGVVYYYDEANSEDVCPGCGVAIFRLENRFIDYNTRKNYNRNARHHYACREHFFQTLLDVTCTGSRNVPDNVMRFCKASLGYGSHVTFQKVFESLRSGGYSAHYPSIHFIAARLRGRAEIILTGPEMRKIRDNHLRYDRYIPDFLEENNLTNKTRRGKRRMYWPFRFIMAEMFKMIGRGDLVVFLRGIASKKREANYRLWWDRLDNVVKGFSNASTIPDEIPELITLTSSRRGSRRPRTRD